MEIKCEYDELVPISKLVHHPRNPNKHSDEQIQRLAEIVEYQGFRHPVIVSKQTGFMVVGHGRLAAAKKLGMTEVPVDYQDFENEAQEYAFIVSDNAIAAWAELDLSMINNDAMDFGPDFDLDMLGIENFEIEPLDKMPDLDGGDRKPMQKMTFFLSDDQADQLNAALEKSKSMGPFVDTINENAKGNALARVAELFIGQC